MKIQIKPLLGTVKERRIVPMGDPYATDFEFVKAWTNEFGVGVCGFTGRRALMRPAEPLSDLSNLLSSRTMAKGKARIDEDNNE